MKVKLLLTVLLSAFAFTLTGCNEGKVEKAIGYIAALAPEGEENAVDGHRILTIKNVGKWNVHFVGLYKEDGYVYADSFSAEGMWTRYEGAPFAWKIRGESP